MNTFFWRKHDVRLFCQFRLKQFVGLSADPPSQEHVPRHDGHASRVDRAKDAVLEQLNLKNKDHDQPMQRKITAALEATRASSLRVATKLLEKKANSVELSLFHFGSNNDEAGSMHKRVFPNSHKNFYLST